ncbi:anion exchange protein, partial [Elysia marginata]
VIPLPVLYGVFLFMGVRALDGMQLVDRVLLYLVSPKYQPDYPYLRHVQLTRVHLYTLIQVMCLAGLWIVKTVKATSIGFPIMVLGTCFIRKALDCLFTQDELIWLDHLLPPLRKTTGGTHKKNTEDIPGFSPFNSSDLHYSHVVVPEINILRNDLDPDPMELRQRAHSDKSDDSACAGNNNTKHGNGGINGKANVAFVAGADVDDVAHQSSGGGDDGDLGNGSSVDGGARSVPQVRIVSD